MPLNEQSALPGSPPSNPPPQPGADAATNTAPNVDPINISTLGEFDFDCEKYMPNFAPGNARIPLQDKRDGTTVHLD